MGGGAPSCPACGETLRATSLSGVDVQVCGRCHGSLLAQIDLIRALDAMSVELLKTVDPDMTLHPVGKEDSAVACPVCARPMSRDDYCGAGLAHFDRCEPCALLWVGAEELGTMTMMWARMERRLERSQERTREALAEADEFLTAVQIGRVLGADRKTPEAFGYVLGDKVGGFLSRLLHPRR
jgi:Zn-finger nucleic acid-binding protein